MPTKDDLKYLQSLSLRDKIMMTNNRIHEWVNRFGENDVYISFSGGKDSRVLLDLVRRLYPNIRAVFCDTGLEYPEIRQFAQSFENVITVRPKMRFDEVIKKYGYPIIGKAQANAIRLARQNLTDGKYTFRLATLGIDAKEAKSLGLILPEKEVLKRYEDGVTGSKFYKPQYKPLLYVDFDISELCCDITKKAPLKEFDNVFIGTTCEESALRETAWLKQGCNAFDVKRPHSTPIAFWTEQDILQYIHDERLSICSVYGDVVIELDGYMYDELITPDTKCKFCTTGCDRTGCIFCGFGVHLEKGESRFERLKRTHPRQYEYCLYGGSYDTDGKWKPDKNGLGMKHVFDECNKIYGEKFIRY